MSVSIVALSLGWGVIAACPVLLVARRVDATRRARRLRARAANDVPLRSSRSSRTILRREAPLLSPFVRVVAGLRSRSARRREGEQLVRELPVAIDVLGVAVGAGCSPFLAVEVAVQWGPRLVGAELAAALQAHRLGVTFDEALRDVGLRRAPLRGLTDTLRDAGRLGVPIRPALARLAHETRVEVRRAAEARARTVPVRLLFPLVFLVLPAFGLLTVAPALLAGLAGQ